MPVSSSASASVLVGRLLWSAIMRYRERTALALALVVAAKLAVVAVPLALKGIVDRLGGTAPELVLPVFLLLAYALLRFAGTLAGELRDLVFARVTQNSVAGFLLQTFQHLHRLSVRFHAVRRTGGVTRDVERGTAGVGFLLGVALFTVLPTLVEIGAVIAVMSLNYSGWFTAIIAATFVIYAAFTVSYTERRAIFQRALNELDSSANSRLVDSLLNYETVKYYTNEGFEHARFGGILGQWIEVGVQNQKALFFLHVGQSGIIAVGVASVMLLAAQNVVAGTMTVGDLVLVNAYVIQVCLPLNSLGFVFRQARDAVVSAERMFRLLDERPEVEDRPAQPDLVVQRGEVRFEHVDFGYEPKRQILWDVSFTIAPGSTVAVVGGSGSGKSTLARLLFRFYDVGAGRVSIDDQDVRAVTQQSLRAAVGIVPQDTILFNDTIAYNIAYGRTGASLAEVIEAARAAHVHEFIAGLPDQYETLVGERGVKLSGGEKQRIAIARAILKNPPILVFDEATSALDTRAERAIQDELERLARERTTLVIAHRLSTVVDADEILVLEHGRVVERGTHEQLLRGGGLYAQMWRLQRQQQELEQAERVLALQPVDLGALAASVIDGLQPALAARALRFFTAIGPEPARVTGDPSALQQALWMLLEQAIAASPNAGRMELRIERIGALVRLTVHHNTLPGYGPHPLVSAPPQPGRPGGVALDALIAQQGGTLSRHAGARGVSSVVVEFALREAPEAVAAPVASALLAAPAAAAPAVPSPVAAIDGLRVVVVDHDDASRALIEAWLHEAGALSRGFASGTPALAWLAALPREEWPDAMVCELALPHEDGHALVHQLRRIEARRAFALDERLPALAVGARAPDEQPVRALLAGFQGYLARPLEAAAVVAAVAAIGGRHHRGAPPRREDVP